MPNLAQSLKQEISRVARKEVRADIAALRKTSSAHRTEIAALRRAIKELGAQLRSAHRAATRSTPQSSVTPTESRRGRKRTFSAERLKAKRLSLGLSQAEMARLLGVSTLSQWKWESGQVSPREGKLARCFEVMAMGKREAAKQLEQRAAKPERSEGVPAS